MSEELRGKDLQHFMEMKYFWPNGEKMELSDYEQRSNGLWYRRDIVKND